MKYLRYILTTLIVTVLFGGYFYYLTISGQIDKNPISNTIVSAVRPYPELTEPKEITLNCDYHGQNLTVRETLYGSLNDYYKTDPAKKNAYLHNREEEFVFNYQNDRTIRDLTDKISAIGTAHGLSSDQTLDLGACFIQSISYDDVKAALILEPDFAKQPISQVIPRYPYETLYDQTGICTDKTYLGVAVLQELGYETAIMTFDSAKHMSLGVAVPEGYGSFGTRYGIMELTGSGFLVGDIPDINASAGLAINNFQTIPGIDETPPVVTQLALSKPSEVIDVSTGTMYSRIVERTATREKLESLKPQVDTAQALYLQAQNKLAVAESTLNTAEATYKTNPTNGTYKNYTTAYNEYLALYNDAQAKINQYNSLVNTYNSFVEKYRQF